MPEPGRRGRRRAGERSMQKTLILWLLSAVLVVLFAVLNSEPVTVHLLFGSVHLSLAFIVVLPLFIGAAAGYTLDIVSRLRVKRHVKELEKELARTGAELEALRAKLPPAGESSGEDGGGAETSRGGQGQGT